MKEILFLISLAAFVFFCIFSCR